VIDIADVGTDLVMIDTQTNRAANILSVQIGALEYAPTLGIDLRYFLTESITFQNASFQAYLIEVLANNGINVASVQNVIHALFEEYKINLVPEENSTALVAR